MAATTAHEWWFDSVRPASMQRPDSCCATNERCLSRPVGFELLLLLVTKRERAMSKQQLHQRLWPSTFMLETNLASLIAEI